MKRIGLTVVLLAFAQALWAESSPDSLVTIMVKHWQVSKELTLAVANAMPEANTLRATPAEMTFGEQMNHIALGNTSYCARAMNTKSPLTKGEDNTKATAIKNLDTAYDLYRRSGENDRRRVAEANDCQRPYGHRFRNVLGRFYPCCAPPRTD